MSSSTRPKNAGVKHSAFDKKPELFQKTHFCELVAPTPKLQFPKKISFREKPSFPQKLNFGNSRLENVTFGHHPYITSSTARQMAVLRPQAHGHDRHALPGPGGDLPVPIARLQPHKAARGESSPAPKPRPNAPIGRRPTLWWPTSEPPSRT